MSSEHVSLRLGVLVAHGCSVQPLHGHNLAIGVGRCGLSCYNAAGQFVEWLLR
jgi:hypothetical protein